MPTITYRSNGSVTVKIAVTGQAVSLGSVFAGGAQTANRVDIQPLTTNTSPIIVGDYQISNTQSNGGILLNVFPYANGIPAQADIYNLELITCLQTLFINGTAGDGVTINWFIGDR
jgi:hypothetical protein